MPRKGEKLSAEHLAKMRAGRERIKQQKQSKKDVDTQDEVFLKETRVIHDNIQKRYDAKKISLNKAYELSKRNNIDFNNYIKGKSLNKNSIRGLSNLLEKQESDYSRQLNDLLPNKFRREPKALPKTPKALPKIPKEKSDISGAIVPFVEEVEEISTKGFKEPKKFIKDTTDKELYKILKLVGKISDLKSDNLKIRRSADGISKVIDYYFENKDIIKTNSNFSLLTEAIDLACLTLVQSLNNLPRTE